MRHGNVGVVLSFCVWGCAFSLEDAPPQPLETQPPVVQACTLKVGDAAAAGVARSVETPDGVLWFLDGLRSDSAPEEANVALLGSVDTACQADWTRLDNASLPAVSPPHALVQGLDVAVAGTRVARFYGASVLDDSQPFGVLILGYGVATGPNVSSLVSGAEFLWTGDRPPFGTALLTHEDYAYVYGCLPARFLSSDCYLARVPMDRIDDVAAYEYWVGSDRYSPHVDAAFPMLAAGTQLSVRWHAASNRFLMAYTEPFGDVILIRTAHGPAGPWSAPEQVGRCALPAEGEAGCYGIELHPWLEPADASVAITYAVSVDQQSVRATHLARVSFSP